jgi:hypothetical protein
VKGVAVFDHIDPHDYTYNSIHAEDKQNLHDYLGGKKKENFEKRKNY